MMAKIWTGDDTPEPDWSGGDTEWDQWRDTGGDDSATSNDNSTPEPDWVEDVGDNAPTDEE